MESGATAKDVAALISSGLARMAIAAKVSINGTTQVVDLSRPLMPGCEVSLLTKSDEDRESLDVLRHSAAHVMAEAICDLFPETKLVYGPPVDGGFYYDVDCPQSITPDHFADIEARMLRIVKEDRPFCRYELRRNEGMVKLRDEGSRYKIDNAERADGDTLSFYVTGEKRGEHFEDLCRGPHVPRTGLIKAFKIQQVSRSFYRGDVHDQPLQRIYGTAFFKKASLTAYLERLEEAKRRDHRVIGKQLDLFAIRDEVGGGLVLWLPKGTIIRTELQNFLTREMLKLGYEMVMTPHIGRLSLYKTSGHYPYYEDSQYPAMFESDRGKALQCVLQLAATVKAKEGEERERGVRSVAAMVSAIQQTWGEIPDLDNPVDLDSTVKALYAASDTEPGYLLRPMNCPHHIQIYASRPRSYRDLPVRLAEYGTVYRFEQSGEISGMTRVRGFTTDDAHMFVTPDQLQDELLATVDLTRRVLATLELADYRVRVGLRDPASDKYVGSAENWARAEDAVRAAAKESGVAWTETVGEAAFYGPKIDFIVKDCIGRDWQLGTVQVDYNVPERFDLTYIGKDNTAHRPIMIHRAPFGSMERFVGILIEHFAGAFPLWLAPVQIAVLTVSEKSEEYARGVYQRLRDADLRVELDVSGEKIGPKKHRHRTAKVNYILVVGESEAKDKTVNVNDRDGKRMGNMPLEKFLDACRAEISSKGRTHAPND